MTYPKLTLFRFTNSVYGKKTKRERMFTLFGIVL